LSTSKAILILLVQNFPEIPHSGTFIGVFYGKRDVPPVRELLGLVSSISLGSLDLPSRWLVSCTPMIVAFGWTADLKKFRFWFRCGYDCITSSRDAGANAAVPLVQKDADNCFSDSRDLNILAVR
jgi:hypothetical protein